MVPNGLAKFSVGTGDSFVELGLDSMSAMSLHSTLCDSSGGKQKTLGKKGMRDRVFFVFVVVVVVVVAGGGAVVVVGRVIDVLYSCVTP